MHCNSDLLVINVKLILHAYKGKANKSHGKKAGLMISEITEKTMIALGIENRCMKRKCLKDEYIFKMCSRLATQLKLDTQRQKQPLSTHNKSHPTQKYDHQMTEPDP